MAWTTQGAAPPGRRTSPSIFVSVAAYADPLLAFTLRSARSQASCPDRVFFGVVEQARPEQRVPGHAEWMAEHVRWIRVDPAASLGPCWARALCMSLYRGEDWFLQVDSHTWFEPGWDERLLDAARTCAALNPRSILTCYPNPFTMVRGEPTALPVTRRVLAHVVRDGVEFGEDDPVLTFECVPVETDRPEPAIHVGAGCLFAPGSIVEELPYDPFLYFHGEEQSFALRAWTRGWDLFHVPAMPLYHLYEPAAAVGRVLHWSPQEDWRRALTSARLDAASRRRLRALLWEEDDLGIYGLGRTRSLDDYARFSGIDYRARTIAPTGRKARHGL